MWAKYKHCGKLSNKGSGVLELCSVLQKYILTLHSLRYLILTKPL